MSENCSSSNNWRFSRQINLTVVIQLVLLASLIVGSWVNLQRQLDILQRDVNELITSQQRFENKCEQLSTRSITFEYRLRAIEKSLPEVSISKNSF